MLKFSKCLYLGKYLSENIHTLTIGRVSFHSMTSDSRVHAGGGGGGVGLELKI